MHADEPARRHSAEGGDGPAFDLLAPKLFQPLVRAGTVGHDGLLDDVAANKLAPIVSVVAPPGYGKTTLLAEWAHRGPEAFAWVSLDEGDNDPRVLLSYVAHALDTIEPVGRGVFDVLGSPTSSVPGSIVPRVGSAFSAMTAPVVLVLDDVHMLHNRACRSAVSVLAEHVPPGARFVLSGRSDPPLRTARLRAEGRLREIGPRELSLSREAAAMLLRNAGVVLSDVETGALYRRTEGWPVGLYLAALCVREGGSLPEAALAFSGEDRLVSEYLESEFLARISRRQRAFLTRTSVLSRMNAALCEAVLDDPGSGALLAELARSNLLLVPLDRRGEWYRYHHLFRDMLRSELQRHEPELVPVLQRRASEWCQHNGMPVAAVEYSMAANDVETVVRLVEPYLLPTHRAGRPATVLRWLRWLDEHEGAGGHPLLAARAAVASATILPPVESERWADQVDRWRASAAGQDIDPVTAAWDALMRAALCRDGVAQMRADADQAGELCRAVGMFVPAIAVLQGVSRVLCGDPDSGDDFLTDGVSLAEQADAHEVRSVALCERAFIATASGSRARADALADEARAVLARAGIVDSYAAPLVCAVQARAALHRGDLPAVRRELVSAQRLRPLLTRALPYLALQGRIELARLHLAIADVVGARTLLREIDEILRRRPDMGTAVQDAEQLRTELSKSRATGAPGASSLTAAELRVLPMLATHLSLPEIAAELSVSPHTVKSHALSIYRKLGASTRSQAVAHARDLTLLDQPG